MLQTLKYVRQYFSPSPDAIELLSSSYERDGQELPATIYRPRGRNQPGTAWIVLHGLTYKGSRHPGLQRFASALTAAGHIVYIPEIPEWTQLRIAPELTLPTLKLATADLAKRDDVDPDRIGIFAFSFGATQGIIAAGDPEIAKAVRAVVAWGGYEDIGRLVQFGLTGEHELDGVRERLEPDPYGRWIFGANYLTSIPGYEDMTSAAAALLHLAQEAGKSGVFAGDVMHDPLRDRLARKLITWEREAFELFAPRRGRHDMAAAAALAKRLAATIVARDPLMDPGPYFGAARIPIVLAHGRDDRLIPYTETLRMRRRLPDALVRGCTVTSLYAHSGGTEQRLGALGLGRESARFLAILNRILTIL